LIDEKSIQPRIAGKGGDSADAPDTGGRQSGASAEHTSILSELTPHEWIAQAWRLCKRCCILRRSSLRCLLILLSGRDDGLHSTCASQATFVAGEPCLFPGPLVRCPLRVRGFSAHPCNLALLRHIHRREPSQLFGHRFLLEPFAPPQRCWCAALAITRRGNQSAAIE
jgi:hypothetical protein